MKIEKKKIVVVAAVVFTVLLGVSAAYVGWRVTQGLPIIPGFSGAASQEVWNAEIPKTAEERTIFANGWRDLEKKENLTFDEAKEYVFGTGARFESNTPILKVGEETLYGKDLNYYMFLYHYKNYTSSEPLTDADIDPGIDILISNSLILQKAEDLGLTELNSTVYNSLNKDYTKRNELVTQYSPEVNKYFVETLEGEVVFIWFNNNTIPVSEEAGKTLAKSKIDAIYTRLESGDITMKEAGDIIINDAEIEQKIDPDADGNAYLNFSTEKNEEPSLFWSPEMMSALFALGEGQLSKVTLAKDESGKEYYYAIIRLNKRSADPIFGSTEEFVDKVEDNLEKNDQLDIQLKKEN